LLRQATQGRYTVTVRVNKGVADIEMEANDEKGNPLNLLEPQVRVTDPMGETHTLLMQQEGLGRYRGRVPVSQTGVYFVSVVEPSGQGKARVYTTAFALAYPTEYRFLRTNLPLLTRLAELTGGRVNPPANKVFQLPPQPLAAATDIWHWCVMAALVLLLMDIAVRRLVIGVPEVVMALQGKLVGWWTRRRQQVAVAPAVTERLRLAKERSALKRRQVERGTIGEIPTVTNLTKSSSPDQPLETTGTTPTASPASSQSRPVAPSDGGAARATERLLTVKRRRRSDHPPPRA
jgi:hypothetical protein